MSYKLYRLMIRNGAVPREPRCSSAKPCAIVDKTIPVVAPPARPQWQVVMLSPSANDGTLARIDAAGFDVWRPCMVVRISSSSAGKKAFVNRPLWPRYAFVARREGCEIALSDVWSIGKPLIVGKLPGSVVGAIFEREAAGEFDCRSSPPKGPVFDSGAHVETLDGLLHGIVRKSDEARTVVLFRLLDADREVVVETARLRTDRCLTPSSS